MESDEAEQRTQVVQLEDALEGSETQSKDAKGNHGTIWTQRNSASD